MNTITIWLPLVLTFLAGISTGFGSLISLFIREYKRSYLQFSLGLSAGVMVYVSFAELLASAIETIGFLKANIAFFGGILLIMVLDFSIPHEYIEERMTLESGDRKLMTTGILTTIGIAIHNFPEGIAVFMSSIGDIRLGIALAVAIAIHNVPEGIAIAMPIFYATKSRKKAFWYSLLSGIAEPVGALIGIAILMPFLTAAILSLSLAFVAGIMVFISFDELLPLSYEGDVGHMAIFGILIGMLIMALSLFLL
jgi:ZIP family zinc transporter